MYAQAIRTPPVYRHRRANNQAHLNMFKGCAFSNEPCDCIKSLKLGDPCCGSGGMFIQSAALVKVKCGDISRINVYGQEKDAATYRLAKMNLAVLTGSN